MSNTAARTNPLADQGMPHQRTHSGTKSVFRRTDSKSNHIGKLFGSPELQKIRPSLGLGSRIRKSWMLMLNMYIIKDIKIIADNVLRSGHTEKILYVPCIVPGKDRPDYLATIDVDPESKNFAKVKRIVMIFLHRTKGTQI